MAEVCLGIAFYFLRKFLLQYKEKGLKKDNLSLVINLMFICYFIAQIYYVQREFMIDFDFTTDTPESLIFLRIGTYVNDFGNWAFLIILDKRVLKGKDKYLIIIAYFILIITTFFINDSDLLGIITVIGNLIILPFIFFYLYAGFKIKGVVRKKAIYIFTGVIIIFLAFILPTKYFLGETILLKGVWNIFKNIGYIFCFLGFKIPIPEDTELGESSEVIIKMLGLNLNRPSFISEEEISISKEKKICLVCKGKLSRYNIYLCPKCDTFYCEKCANTLAKLENACWYCNMAFDPLRPQTIKKEEPEKVLIKGS